MRAAGDLGEAPRPAGAAAAAQRPAQQPARRRAPSKQWVNRLNGNDSPPKDWLSTTSGSAGPAASCRKWLCGGEAAGDRRELARRPRPAARPASSSSPASGRAAAQQRGIPSAQLRPGRVQGGELGQAQPVLLRRGRPSWSVAGAARSAQVLVVEVLVEVVDQAEQVVAAPAAAEPGQEEAVEGDAGAAASGRRPAGSARASAAARRPAGSTAPGRSRRRPPSARTSSYSSACGSDAGRRAQPLRHRAEVAAQVGQQPRGGVGGSAAG